MTARAVYHGYFTGSKRAGQVKRLHIIREQGPGDWPPGSRALCGTGVWSVSHSESVILSPMPAQPPEGLSWCPACVGKQAELSGLLGEFAARLAGL
jgi:hypothetical protein